jgi:hypothetical protein
MLYKRREALEQSLDEPDDEDEQPEMMQEEGVSEPTDSVNGSGSPLKKKKYLLLLVV